MIIENDFHWLSYCICSNSIAYEVEINLFFFCIYSHQLFTRKKKIKCGKFTTTIYCSNCKVFFYSYFILRSHNFVAGLQNLISVSLCLLRCLACKCHCMCNVLFSSFYATIFFGSGTLHLMQHAWEMYNLLLT